MRLIDADALKKFIGTYDGTTAQVEAVEVKYIDNAPTVCNDNYAMGYQDGVRTVLSERPQGEWIETDSGTICNRCGAESRKWANFCPNCGADMRGGRE